tara:strand:- start:198 stop:395 length:198 start_codon:yes stop_codon:yes gene_type:complete
MTYNYIVWVGGVDDYYTDLNQAIQHFEEWIEKGYEDVILQEIKTNKILRRQDNDKHKRVNYSKNT